MLLLLSVLLWCSAAVTARAGQRWPLPTEAEQALAIGNFETAKRITNSEVRKCMEGGDREPCIGLWEWLVKFAMLSGDYPLYVEGMAYIADKGDDGRSAKAQAVFNDPRTTASARADAAIALQRWSDARAILVADVNSKRRRAGLAAAKLRLGIYLARYTNDKALALELLQSGFDRVKADPSGSSTLVPAARVARVDALMVKRDYAAAEPYQREILRDVKAGGAAATGLPDLRASYSTLASILFFQQRYDDAVDAVSSQCEATSRVFEPTGRHVLACRQRQAEYMEMARRFLSARNIYRRISKQTLENAAALTTAIDDSPQSYLKRNQRLFRRSILNNWIIENIPRSRWAE